jgi:Fe2+ or Zn2+ uptake regulation protein
MGSSRIPSKFVGRKPTSYDLLSYLIKNSKGYIKNISEHSQTMNGGIHKTSLYRAIKELSQKGIIIKINLGGKTMVGFNPELRKELIIK